MTRSPKLYAIFKVEFPHNSNPYILQEQLEDAKDTLYDIFSAEQGAEIPCVDITYETVMEVTKETTRTERT